VKVPVTIQGAVTAPVSTVPPVQHGSTLALVGARVVRDSSVTEWFGGSAKRELHLVLRNEGSTTIQDPRVSAGWGSRSSPHVIDMPKFPPIPPLSERTVVVPFSVDGPAWGTTPVFGRFGVLGAGRSFKTSTTSYPWGLLVAGLVLLQLVVLAVRNRMRRRVDREAADDRAAATEDTGVEELPTAVLGAAPVNGEGSAERVVRWRPSDAFGEPRAPGGVPVNGEGSTNRQNGSCAGGRATHSEAVHRVGPVNGEGSAERAEQVVRWRAVTHPEAVHRWYWSTGGGYTTMPNVLPSTADGSDEKAVPGRQFQVRNNDSRKYRASR
jgi:hypothetical protein